MTIPDSVIANHQRLSFLRFGRTASYIVNSGTVDFGTGVATPDESSDESVSNVLVSQVSARTVANSGGKILAGDVLFRWWSPDLPASINGQPSIKHKIYYEGKYYRIIRYRIQPQGVFTDIYGRHV